MRFSVSTIAVTSIVAVATATEDACSQMCSEIDGCRLSKHGSYCKGWMTPSVCFGIVKRVDGSYCFQPGDASCIGEAVSCNMGPVTTAEPTESPVTTTIATTTKSYTTGSPVETTTAAVDTAAPVTTTEGVATTTTPKETTVATTTTPKETTVATTTTVAPTTITTTTTKATTAAPAFGGQFCGNVMGQSFKVDFASNGRATINVMGMSAGADYTVNGDAIEFSNYDPMLAKLMNQFGINSIDATIVSADSVHIKIGVLVNTTITKC